MKDKKKETKKVVVKEKTTKVKTAKADMHKKAISDDTVDDVVIDEEENENLYYAKTKETLLKKGKKKGSLDLGDIVDETKKFDLSDNDLEQLIDRKSVV